jgi:heme A synthase
VRQIHLYIGYAIPSGFLLLALWALVAFIRNRNPRELFWHLLAVLQVVIAVQFVVGAVMFAGGGRAAPGDRLGFLHYFYGAFFPAAVLVWAHVRARSERWRQIPWALFGIAAFVNFGLTARALMTGLGVG